jgi:hypothetical protein
MALKRFKLDRRGVRELLNCEEMAQMVEETGKEIAQRCGEGYEAAPAHRTGQRVASNVYPATKEAFYDNLEHNTLRKAIGG